ncbi:acid resistance repetitive basic protein Asr [Salmonella enterica subsp. enterica]|nr:acid resistance repetitive basic protein Asr [Salmonella enterica subsp. enterica]
MKKVLALVVAAAMGLSSAAFAAETAKHHDGENRSACQNNPEHPAPQKTA